MVSQILAATDLESAQGPMSIRTASKTSHVSKDTD